MLPPVITPAFMLGFPTNIDARGALTVLDGWQHIPFAVKRIYWIYNVPEGAQRGGHAHKACQQVLIAVAGKVHIIADKREFWLNTPERGLYIPPNVSLTLDQFSPDAVLLVLCSHLFAEEDYIHDEIR